MTFKEIRMKHGLTFDSIAREAGVAEKYLVFQIELGVAVDEESARNIVEALSRLTNDPLVASLRVNIKPQEHVETLHLAYELPTVPLRSIDWMEKRSQRQ